MFWKRDKTVRVELVNPEIRLKAEQTASFPESNNQPTAPVAASQTNLELSLKLVALAAVAMQGLLVVYGYCALAGEYDAFGISMNELDIGISSLLFYGYISLLLDTIIPLSHVPHIGAVLQAILYMLLAGGIVWYFKRTSLLEEKLKTTVLLSFVLFLLVILPILILNRGQKSGLEDIAQHGLSAPASQLQKTHIIQTDQGEKQGMLITATTKYTFLLAGTEVLKINNDSNKVIRVTKLSAKE